MRSALRNLAVACTALGATLAAWGTVDTVDKDTATIGTTFQIQGSGFGMAKAPKVVLSRIPDGKQIKLKVSAYVDSQITAQLVRTFNGAAGDYGLVVTPPGGEAQSGPGTVTLVVGTIDFVSPQTPGPGDTVTISGFDFGTKKGKVVVGGKKAKVTSWSDNEIVATLHKKTPEGAQAVQIVNKIGTAEQADAVIVGGSGGGGGDCESTAQQLLCGRFGGTLISIETPVIEFPANGVKVNGFTEVDGATYLVSLDLSNADLSEPGPTHYSPAGFAVQRNLGEDFTAWQATPGQIDAVVSVTDTTISVQFSGTLSRTSGTFGTDSLPVTNGVFRTYRF